jgi:DNA-binding MarR family transcriptional regulator
MSRRTRDELRTQLGDEIRAHQAAVNALDEAAAANLGINRTDLRCIDALIQSGPTTPGQLAGRLGLTTGSVTALLDRLQRLGYLTRTPDPTDRRRILVDATAEATAKAAAVYGPLAEEGAKDIARYSVTELELLIDYLRRGRALQDKHAERVRTTPAARDRRRAG